MAFGRKLVLNVLNHGRFMSVTNDATQKNVEGPIMTLPASNVLLVEDELLFVPLVRQYLAAVPTAHFELVHLELLAPTRGAHHQSAVGFPYEFVHKSL